MNGGTSFAAASIRSHARLVLAALSIPMAAVKGRSQAHWCVWANLPKSIQQGKGSVAQPVRSGWNS